MKRFCVLLIVCLVVVLAGCAQGNNAGDRVIVVDDESVDNDAGNVTEEEGFPDADVEEQEEAATPQPTEAEATEEETAVDSGYATVTATADEPVAAVSVGDGYGYINTIGEWVIAPQYVWAFPFEDNVATVATQPSGGWRLIDKDNHVIAEFPADIIVDTRGMNRYDTVHKGATIVEGMIIIARDPSGTISGDATQYGYANARGEIVVEPQYAEVEPFSDGLAAVNFGTRAEPNWGFIDQTGQVAVQPAYYRVDDFSDGLAYVEKDQNKLSDEDRRDAAWCGFIDHTGALVIHPQWDETGIFTIGFGYAEGCFSDGLAVVHYAWPADDDSGALTHDGLAIMDKSGNAPFKTAEYTSNPTYGFSEGLYTINGPPDSEGNAPTGFMDTEGNIAIAPQSEWKIEYARMFSDGMCAVYTRGMIGFIDHSGNLAVTPQYWSARDFTCDLAAVSADGSGYGGWQYIDKAGNVVIAGPFGDAWPFSS